MNMRTKTKKALTALIVLVCAAALIAGALAARSTKPAGNNPYYTISYELARVEKVLVNSYTVDDDAEHALRGSQSLNVKLITGIHEGDVMPVMNYLGPLHEKLAKEGTVLTVMITEDSREAGYQISVINYDLTWVYIALALLFAAAVLIVGRKKGFLSILGLVYSLLAIVLFLVPMWLKGYGAIPLTLVTALFITLFSFTLLGGFSQKTAAAVIGTFACVLISGALAWAAGAASGISGMNMDEAEWLLDEAKTLGRTLNVRGLFVSGIIISSLGAVMDVAMSISSAVNELHEVDRKLPQKQLFRSGMNIGRDMIGTMTNTLILAFVGSSFNLIIIMFAAGMQPYQLLNNDDMIMEVIRGVAGSVGLVLAVPLTAFAASFAGKTKRTRGERR